MILGAVVGLELGALVGIGCLNHPKALETQSPHDFSDKSRASLEHAVELANLAHVTFGHRCRIPNPDYNEFPFWHSVLMHYQA